MIDVPLALQRAGIELRHVHMTYVSDYTLTTPLDGDEDPRGEHGYIIERNGAVVGLLTDWDPTNIFRVLYTDLGSQRFDVCLPAERSWLPQGSVFRDTTAVSGNDLQDVLERFLPHPALPHLTHAEEGK